MSVEQAAERLRRDMSAKVYEESPYFDVETNRLYAHRRNCDERTVLDAWFDQRPLTDEILRLTGYQKTASEWWVCDGAPELTDSDDAGRRYVFGVSTKYGIETVGDLRRLLSALHIDCPVVVPESEVGNG